MGFTAGLVSVLSSTQLISHHTKDKQFGGITLTSSLLYLSSPSTNEIVSTSIPPPTTIPSLELSRRASPRAALPPRYVLDKPSIVETVKDAWNEDIEGLYDGRRGGVG
jgi:hypothetical protein